MSTCWILHGVKFVNYDIDCALFRQVQRFIISMATVSRLFHGWQRTRLTSAQLEILDSLRGFSQGQNCWRKIAVILSFSSAKKSHWGKISSFVVLDVCSLPVRARRCRTVSSFVHWKLVSHGLRQQCCLSSWGLLQILKYFICLSKSGVSCNGKWFFERRQAKEAICKLTCHLSSSQTCKNSSEKYLVLLLTFVLPDSNFWCHQD